MSEDLFATLPRFDALHRADVDPIEDVGIEDDGGDINPDAEATPQDTLAAEETPAPPPAIEPEVVDSLLAALANAITHVEQTAQSQIQTTMVTMAERLFPELAQQFLAHEIERNLEKLVPVSVPAVTITAPEALLEALSEALGRAAHLDGRAALKAAEPGANSAVEVSWETGGLTFDFDGLLAACLAQLPQRPAPPTEDYHV